MAQVRHLEITNTTGALLTSVPMNQGQDYAFETLQWTFTANDVGTGAGDTGDTTSNPTVGFLFAQVKGAVFKNVVSLNLIKAAAAAHTTVFNYFTFADAATPSNVKIGYRIVNTTRGGGVVLSSLYIIDSGTNPLGQIASGDKLVVSVELGNT